MQKLIIIIMLIMTALLFSAVVQLSMPNSAQAQSGIGTTTAQVPVTVTWYVQHPPGSDQILFITQEFNLPHPGTIIEISPQLAQDLGLPGPWLRVYQNHEDFPLWENRWGEGGSLLSAQVRTRPQTK